MATFSSFCPVEGYDKVLGDVRNVALRGQRSVQGAAAVEMHYKVCQSMEDVRCMLQIDHSSILGLFKVGNNISDKLHFLNSLTLTTHSLAIVVFVQVITGGHTITDASLSVATPQDPMEMEQFVRVYGDSYVSKVVTGAEYYASFTYYATTREEKMDLFAKMKAEGVLSWGSGDASIDSKISKFNSSCNAVSMEFHQSMRGISGVALPESTHLLDFVLKFPTLTIDKPYILHFESVSYEHAKGFEGTNFVSLMLNRSSTFDDTSFLSLLYRVKGLENDVQAIEAMLRRYGMYEGSTRSFLDEVKGAIKIDKGAVQSMMKDYKHNTVKEVVKSSTIFKSLDYEERVQSSFWTEAESMYNGGPGGEPRDYVTNVREFISSSRRIVSIQLRSSHDRITSITIKYNNTDKFEWGGSVGVSSNILHVPDGEYFSKIRIEDNGYAVNYLEFVLTNGNSISGGFLSGSRQAITYEPYKAPNFHYFCGFQARSGESIFGLRAVFAKFKI